MTDTAKKIIIGSRGSKLALWQAHFVQGLLEKEGITSEIKIIKTKGDLIQDLSFDKIEGKGFFTKEIEEALLAEEIDLAVHSMKDMPTTPVPGLILAGVSYRANPCDVLLVHADASDDAQIFGLKENAIVGTSSARRQALIQHYRPDVKVKVLRGNVPTRINKLAEGNYDAIILAAAGIERLEIQFDNIKAVELNEIEFVPAPAQGVITFQTRQDDIAMRRTVQLIHNSEVSSATNVERKVLQLMDGGCQMPLGVHCKKDQLGNYHVYAAFSKSLDEEMKVIRYSSSTSHELAETIVEMLHA